MPSFSKSYERLFLLLPLIFGITSFFLVVGSSVLSPTNISWLANNEDSVMHYLGWAFFRQSPWTFPLGLNPAYGLEISSAIVYSDSIPLFAFIFKLFSGLLPQTFQYFGIWIFLCFILQALLSWQLLDLVTKNPLIRILGVGFFVFAPPMIWRLHEKIGHEALVGQFLILGALNLSLKPQVDHRQFKWCFLLIVASLTHAYFLAMLMMFWLADLMNRSFKSLITIKNGAIEIFILGSLITIVCWQAGYFSVSTTGLQIGGYGRYRANLLSFLDPGKTEYGLWSYFLPDISGDAGQHEGFNFLGLGVLALIPFACRPLLSGHISVIKVLKKNFLFLLMLLGMTIFSLTHILGFGNYSIEFKLSGWLLDIANIFRASGRLMWPIFYTTLFVLISLVIIGYKQKTVVAILGMCLILQIADTSSGWLKIRKALNSPPNSSWNTTLVSPFWTEAALNYKKIRSVPLVNSKWMVIAQYASMNGMSTDAAYLARFSSESVKLIYQKDFDVVENLKYDSDTLYILDDATFHNLSARVNSSIDSIGSIDGFNVLAPGWNVRKKHIQVK
jgi:hypothetical protein